jgi:Fur family peroxide stress response transcriptional regulator
MQKAAHQATIQTFLQTCRNHRLKITPQRVAIFKKLTGLGTHPTADEVYQMVKKDFSNISLDTVNRTLLTFAEIGVVDVVETFGGAKRFDPDVSNHHHFYCIQCGEIIDFKDPSYDDLSDPENLQHQFQIISKRVILKGFCNACLNHKSN